MPNPDMRDVVVTQADRDAAAAAFPATVETTREAIRLALFDSSAPVQAFARHRLAAEAECATREEALEKALLEMALLEIAEGQHVDVFEKGRLVLRPYNPAEIARAALLNKGAAS